MFPLHATCQLITLNDKFIFTFVSYHMTFNSSSHPQTLNCRTHDSTLTGELTTYSSPEEQEFYHYYHQFWREFEQELYDEYLRKSISDSSHPSFK